MYIKDTNRAEAINIISHELIHLIQYNDRSLVTENGTILWLGKPININNMAYFERPWEIDALEQQDALAYKIRLALY
jgi:energy-coupling factor transporter ATP-binding protein EcfA2